MSNARRVRLLHYGLGPIGASIVRYVARRGDFDIVGAVDIAPDKAGVDLGSLAGMDKPLCIAVESSLSDALPSEGADVAILCTKSRIREAEPQIMELVNAGLNVVSTCEELSYPYRRHGQEAKRIHEAAERNGVTVLSTGVNPGFVMDLLPIVMSTVCLEVESVRVRRVVDAGTRRGPLQAKVGAGLSVQEFEERVRTGELGHKGFVESVAMIADSLCIPVETITDEVRPKLVDHSIGNLRPGDVAGIDQTATGLCGNEARVSLRLLMYVGAHDPRDRVVIRGNPEVRLTLEGGTPGDQATAAATINAIPRVFAAPPGLTTVNALAPQHWTAPRV